MVRLLNILSFASLVVSLASLVGLTSIVSLVSHACHNSHASLVSQVIARGLGVYSIIALFEREALTLKGIKILDKYNLKMLKNYRLKSENIGKFVEILYE